MATNSYLVKDGGGDILGDVQGELDELLEEVPPWENDLQRTLGQIVIDNQGWIEDEDGKIVFDSDAD